MGMPLDILAVFLIVVNTFFMMAHSMWPSETNKHTAKSNEQYNYIINKHTHKPYTIMIHILVYCIHI